ncbi:hypothetical protein [Chitinophaga sp. Cy-1792]|uniref:hypothetical protein n=1 Tax=Chitinophaga sp. Cy-1792 TaxID=2608339 RepID=UPI00141DEB09|nr:hypothetical protein [Chitinophaga sp. Cy-1792]NIG53418.1 hypothetical protein [Chitinophaga sp. Cy-1792]
MLQRVISFFFIFLCACTTSRKSADILQISKESYCDPPTGMIPNGPVLSHNADSLLAANQHLSSKYSASSILVLYALGILEDVNQIYLLKKDSLNSVKELLLRRHINDKILLGEADISSLAAELDCEGERIDQIAKYVDDINSKRTTKFTVTSIIVGALAGVAGSVISNSGWNKGVAITAGAAAIGLGLATLNPKGRKAALTHQRNLLRDIWLQENNHDISPFIWFMLTEKRISNTGNNSLVENLKQRWIKYQFDGNANKAQHSVIFTDGGIYRASDLHNRAEMLNQLQAEIRSLAQPLNIFLRELSDYVP